MSYRTGTILRNGFTDSAVVLKDGSIYELKRDGRAFNHMNKDERRTFVDVASWRASLSKVDEIKEDNVFARVPKTPMTSRVFSYPPDAPHWEIAADILMYFKCRTNCHVETLKEKQQGLVKAKIALLKLDLDPPQFDDPLILAFLRTVEGAKGYIETSINHYNSRIAEYSKYNNGAAYYAYVVNNPKVFVKYTNSDEMLPLGVHVDSEQIVLNRCGYKTFQEATKSPEMPEFWVLWNKKMTKLRVEIV